MKGQNNETDILMRELKPEWEILITSVTTKVIIPLFNLIVSCTETEILNDIDNKLCAQTYNSGFFFLISDTSFLYYH